MRETSTQFAARILKLQAPVQPTDEPHCWLCGGDTGGEGVPVADVIGAAFTDHPRKHMSTMVCRGCAATVKVAEFQRIVAERGMGLKTWAQCGFNNYSHFISEDPDTYECPKPARMRDILMYPPDGPWLLAINESGKKHTLAKAVVNTSRQTYAVVVEDELLWTTRSQFSQCLDHFETMSALGFTKDEIRSGHLQPESVRRAGVPGRHAEERMRSWRRREPHLVALVHHVARSRAFYQAETETAA